MMKEKTVGIVGLGLMGGSLGLALKNIKQVNKIIGFDNNLTHQVQALDLKIVDKIVSYEEILKADIIILATPVEVTIKLLKNIKKLPKDTLIMDLGSTKEKIVDSVPDSIRKNFVAAHPMTGIEKSGPSYSTSSLYNNKVVLLCDLEDTGEKQYNLAIKFFKYINMLIIKTTSKSHDKHVSYISHLPHLISFALVNTVLDNEKSHNILNLAAGGFKDTSRLAKSDSKMWIDIFKQNSENMLDTIEEFEKNLSLLKDTIKNKDWDVLDKEIKKANKISDIL